MNLIQLDYQAGWPMQPEVIEAMRQAEGAGFGNAGSGHRLGASARRVLEEARAKCAAFLRASAPEEILFTGSGTEALNLAIKGTAWADRRLGDHFVLTQTEHPAVTESVAFLESQGLRATRVKVDGQGLVRPDDVREAITDQTILVCVHHTHADLGTIQPLAEIGAMAEDRGIPLMVDATMSGGWLPIDVEGMHASFVALAPHRFGGPRGVGVLYRRRGARLVSLVHGGRQEHGLRAGTENVPGIVGAGIAAEAARVALAQRRAHATACQRRLWSALQRRLTYWRWTGPVPGARRHPAHLSLCVEFVEGEALMLRLDQKGVIVHTGPSCVTRSMRVPPALAAIGIEPRLAAGSLTLSLGPESSEEELDVAVERLVEAVTWLRSMSPAWEAFQAGKECALTPVSGGSVASEATN